MIGISLAEYDRRWDVIMVAFQTGRLSPREASDAIRELTSQIIWR
jgi:hypothetical protein